MLLRVGADNERGDVDDLLANANVSLSDEDASVVDGLGEALLEDLGLQSALEESLGGELEDIIEGRLLLGHEAESLQSVDQRRGLEQALGVLGVKGKQSSGSLR